MEREEGNLVAPAAQLIGQLEGHQLGSGSNLQMVVGDEDPTTAAWQVLASMGHPVSLGTWAPSCV